MTITDDNTSWKDLAGPADDATVARCIAGTKRWLLRSGGVMAVKRAERVGAMIVLSGVDVVSGHPCASSVHPADVVGRAA